MEIDQIIKDVFEVDPMTEYTDIKTKPENSGRSRTIHSLNLVNDYIKNTLFKNAATHNSEDNRIGRIGPNIVKFDILTRHGLFILSRDRLSVNSESNFSTMRANTGIFKGKWMYELQLGSKGVMQVGWGTIQCKFNQKFGVGDTVNSYAYDGNRVRKWNVTTEKYGEPWLTGDIIGCALDMDEGTIDFYRNGRHLGRAFENIPMGAGVAYFPTVSLASTENLRANFGSTPLRYPVEGYQPLQEAPKDKIAQANLLFKWFLKIIELFYTIKNAEQETSISLHDKVLSIQAFLMCLARSVLKYLGPIISVPYITELLLISFIQEIVQDEEYLIKKSDVPQNHISKLSICLDLLWAFLEEQEIKVCLENIVLHLLSAFRHVSLLLEYPDQSKSVILLTKICQHSVTCQYLLQHLLFDRVRFANFVHVNPLDKSGLTNVVNNVWWETNPLDMTIDAQKKDYFHACKKIKAAISEVETVQVNLLITLLNNSDGDTNRPTSRSIFLRRFKYFVQENLISNRLAFLQTTSIIQTPLPITLCCFDRLLVAFKVLWDTEVGTAPIYIPCRVFYDASINYSGIDRLGGVLSHLNKTFKSELLKLLGPEHEVIVAMEETEDPSNTFSGTTRLADLPIVIPTFTRMVNFNSVNQGNSMILERLVYFPHNRENSPPMRLGPADPTTSLLELLDAIILFYHVAAKKQLAKVASLRDSMTEYISAIADTKARLELIKTNSDSESQSIQKELMRTINVFKTKLSEQARHMAWIHAAVYSEEKQMQLSWLLRVVTLTLNNASKEGNMFSFVPDFYLEALADLCVGLRNHLHPTARIEQIPDYQQVFMDAAEFLCNHFLDPRIVHANAKDTLILTLAGFVSSPLTLEALESVPHESRIKVITNLLKPYENRAWAQSNWVLVRFWQGNGFAFRYEKSPHLSKKIGPKLLQQESISQPIKPCPSIVFQTHIKDILLDNPQSTEKFLNSLLNQLNWAFSEFIGTVQEIHNVSSRPKRVFIESRQLKICATCFDLAISLLRVLEMIISVAPSVFTDLSKSSNENLLSRLCQLLCQVLNRMSSQTSCFQHVVLLEIPDLESVDHFPILAAVIGILLALLKEDISNFTSKSISEVPKVTKTLLTEPSFQMSSLYFVLGDTKHKDIKVRNTKPFSFLNYPDDVTEDEVNSVKHMIQYMDTCRTILPDSKMISDDDNTCTICYAFPIAATFKPCNHQTCRICIDRHLLNTRQCFFCKATINKVIDLFGNTLHDFSDEDQTSRSAEIS